MFRRMHVPIVGLVENMSHHVCKQCGHVEHTFGEGGVARTAVDLGLDVLGEVRLSVAYMPSTHPPPPHDLPSWMAP